MIPSSLRNTAIISGIVGFVLFVLTPFLPVVQTQSSLSWPQGDSLGSVNAPLISYAPEKIEATVPLDAELRDGESLILSTLPESSTDATSRGLFVRSSDGNLDVTVRDRPILHLEEADIPDGAELTILQDEHETVAKVSGTDAEETLDEDLRPQVTGVYSELESAPESLGVNVEINSRFTSRPSAIKYAAMFIGLAMLVVSLVALHKMDTYDGRSSRRFLPTGWWKLRPLDAIVGGILILWHFIGANTSDDGFLLTMARASREAGYMANYYRWYGVPESPFGAPYYDLLGLMSQVSSTSVWMRLPALISGLVVWAVLSREILPRLGTKIAGRRVAQWSAAMVFLAFWLPYNNGTRPEPIIAMGAVLTWASFERSIATSRLLPAAVGVIMATLSLGAGPTGLMAVSALLVSLSSLIRIVYRRLPLYGGSVWASVASMIAPFMASGTAILIAVFGDQTWASVMESIRVRAEKGPALEWYNEWARYQTLMEQTVDGSLTRRFAVFMLAFCLALVIASLLRKGRVPGAAVGATQRAVLIIFGTMFFMMFTPTKWTHHFGVYAGIAGALAALAAVVLSHLAVRSARNRTLMIGAVLMLLAICLAGTNGWWYISSFGVPWYDKPVQLKGIQASTVVLFLALAVLALGVIQSFIRDIRSARAETEGTLQEFEREETVRAHRFVGLASAPIAVFSALIVVFSIASLAKGFVSQYPAYSVGLGNLRSLTGKTCSMANDTLVETDSNESFLHPADKKVDFGESLNEKEGQTFEANNVPTSISAEGVDTSQAGAIADSSNSGGSEDATGQNTGNAGGVRGDIGINGSRARLPFNLDYRRIPVVGSWQGDSQQAANVTTEWYQLPEQQREDAPLLVVSAAGRIAHHDINGVFQNGEDLKLEYGTRGEDGQVTGVQQVEMMDLGPQMTWRNLRFPLDQLPPEANVVRIVADDDSLNQDDWLAFTPPRVPTLDTLNNVIGPDEPGMLDWSVGLQFPCQRPFDHFAGVTEIPTFRISPDAPGKVTLSPFQDFDGGGAMGTAEAVNSSYELPSYLKNDWMRDWGSIEIYRPRTDSRGKAPAVADIHHEEITRSGLWKPSEMKID